MKTAKIGIALILTILVANCAIFQTNQYYSMPVQPPSSNINNQGSYYWNPSVPGYTPPETSSQTQPIDQSYLTQNTALNQGSTSSLNPADQELVNRAKFADFKRNYGKFYNSPEESYRYSVFVQNLKKINQDNLNPVLHRQAMNQFSDLTSQEFAAIYLTASVAPVSLSAVGLSATATSSGRMLTSVTPIDWRSSGKVNPIKDQGQCGSCWSFSVVGTIETNNALKRNTSPGTYSQQQLVDCCGTRGYQCNGCNGGWVGSGFDYISQYGLTTSASYPYVAAQQACRDNQATFPKYLNTAASYAYQTGTSNAQALIRQGVISVLVDANTWQFYSSGVLSCGSSINLNHAVILVGIESDGTYIVRNSWGTSWGISGYIRLNGSSASNADCGLSQYLLVPNLL